MSNPPSNPCLGKPGLSAVPHDPHFPWLRVISAGVTQTVRSFGGKKYVVKTCATRRLYHVRVSPRQLIKPRSSLCDIAAIVRGLRCQ